MSSHFPVTGGKQVQGSNDKSLSSGTSQWKLAKLNLPDNEPVNKWKTCTKSLCRQSTKVYLFMLGMFLMAFVPGLIRIFMQENKINRSMATEMYNKSEAYNQTTDTSVIQSYLRKDQFSSQEKAIRFSDNTRQDQSYNQKTITSFETQRLSSNPETGTIATDYKRESQSFNQETATSFIEQPTQDNSSNHETTTRLTDSKGQDPSSNLSITTPFMDYKRQEIDKNKSTISAETVSSKEQISTSYEEDTRPTLPLLQEETIDLRNITSRHRLPTKSSNTEYLPSPRLVMKVRDVNPDIGHQITGMLVLPEGGALVGHGGNYKFKITRIDNQGKTRKHYKLRKRSVSITGFILLGNDFLCIQGLGTITRFNIKTGQEITVFKVQAHWLSGGLALDKDNIILADYKHILQYDMTQRTQKTKVKKLRYPKSIGRAVVNGDVQYVVSERDRNILNVYDSKWNKLHTIGEDGFIKFKKPWGIEILPSNNIIVSDHSNNIIRLISLQGKLKRDLLTAKEGLKLPKYIGYSINMLWVMGRGFLDVYEVFKI